MKKVRLASRKSTSPLAYPTTVRNHDLTVLTSMPAGKMTPIAVVPMLREDSARVRLSLSTQMMETSELLLNEVHLSVKAYLVPHLAFERFTSVDDLNRSYEGKPARDGLPITPFIEKMQAKGYGEDEILYYLGKHAKPGSDISTAYHEAYNLIWNLRAVNRSPDIEQRQRLEATLAPAFWHHSRFDHIVPDWDQAVMDGEVALNVVNAKMPVRGIGLVDPNKNRTFANAMESDGSADNRAGHFVTGGSVVSPNDFESRIHIRSAVRDEGGHQPDVFAELQENGIAVSLANIELARKTQAFARMREQYAGHSDDFLIDLLMDGITVPEQMWKQPMLLQEKSTIYGMAKRYASDGGNLTESVVNGASFIDMNFGVPKCPVGGVVMIVAEATPGQLFERGRDPYLHLQEVDDLPHAMRDTLDPEPVEAVRNDYIDIDHDSPGSTFGYAPLNHAWNYAAPCIGGRFYRPEVDAPFDEDRLRIWAVETQNPVLSEDFYIVKEIHQKPFVDPLQDPFEIQAVGAASLTGLTQFGPALIEASDNYNEVLAEAPQTRIEKGQ